MEVANEFFAELQRQAFAHAGELLDEVEGAAQRLWTSERTMRCAAKVSVVAHLCIRFKAMALVACVCARRCVFQTEYY